MRDGSSDPIDYLVVGGGFYGCCLALFLRSISQKIEIVEAKSDILTQASRVNQARVHTGFHYPRSVLTAAKSMALHRRFMRDFPEAIKDDFTMLYAIARRQSKVSAKRFGKMFADMGAPIRSASRSQSALFDHGFIEDVFSCEEYAFDYSVLRKNMWQRLDTYGIEPQLETEVLSIEERDDYSVATLSTGVEIAARYIFNVTYGGLNEMLRSANLPQAKLKYELTEIALVEPSSDLQDYGITVMDGPFFSIMPYPAEKLHSLTHVRYTPRMSWTDESASDRNAYSIGDRGMPNHSAFPQMMRDSRRYVPCIGDVNWKKSIYTVKVVLVKNEHDDGRPILFQRRPSNSRVISVLGGKIDNIYDLFSILRMADPEWEHAHDHFVLGTATNKGNSA